MAKRLSAVIPARARSKRIPYKNARAMLDRPLIHWPIKAAIESELFARVIVSTDDEGIASQAMQAGAEVPFMRPAALAEDGTPVVAVVRHAIREAALGATADVVALIYATAPLLTPERLRTVARSLDGVLTPEAPYAASVVRYPHPIERALVFEDGAARMDHTAAFARTQTFEPHYHDAGQFVFGLRDAWLKGPSFWEAGAIPIEVPRAAAIDIDTFDDWALAEALLRGRQNASV